jgi:hypothetical protein
MPRKKVSTRKKATPRIKTQESFEEHVKEELQSVSGSSKTTKLKRKRRQDTSLLGDAPAKTKPKKKASVPTLSRPEHQTRISELNEIKFDEKKFAAPKLSEVLKKGSNGVYVNSILYRNMIDFLKREQFYLGNVAGPDKTKIKAALQKDLSYIKTLVKSM